MGAGAVGGVEIRPRQSAQGKSRQWRYGERCCQTIPADAGHAGMAGRCAHRAEDREVAAEFGGPVTLAQDLMRIDLEREEQPTNR